MMMQQADDEWLQQAGRNDPAAAMVSGLKERIMQHAIRDQAAPAPQSLNGFPAWILGGSAACGLMLGLLMEIPMLTQPHYHASQAHNIPDETLSSALGATLSEDM